jgi:phage terminase small subunit
MADNKEIGLTDKQERFCQEYLIDLNGAQAAIRAGYSENSAKEEASRLLTKANVKGRIKELQEQISLRLEITQDWVLKRFKDISDRCMTAEPVMIRDEEGNLVESGEYRFDSNGANKATENIAKHLGFFEKDNKKEVVTKTADLTEDDIKKLAKGLDEKY